MTNEKGYPMMMVMADADLTSSLKGLEGTLNEYLGKKAPQLPKGVKNFIVALAPWATLIALIVTVPLVLLALGLGALVAPFAFLAGPQYGVTYGATYTVSMVVLAAAVVLEAFAVPGLFARSRSGWRLVYWATLVSLVSNVINLSIVNGLLSALISLYFLFQVREYYK